MPSKKPASTKPDDAIDLLVADHQEVHALFVAYKKLVSREAGADERQPLAEQICTLLTVHAAIEEEIFYPAARAAKVESALLDEAVVEHQSLKDLIAQLRAMSADDALYDSKVTVLGEYVDHHVKEEQDEMFPKCRKARMDLQQIGAQLAQRKEELTAEQMEGMELVR